jgi:membrane protease subunit HflC
MLLIGAAVITAAVRSVFFVDESQYVYVTQFGHPIEFLTQPGLHFKWPYQSVWRFDRRLQMYEPPARELLTEDKENLNFAWYVCWRIASPQFAADHAGQKIVDPGDATEICVRRYLQAIGETTTAESRLEERIQAALAAEIGRTRFAQLVSLDPKMLELEPLAERVTQAVRGPAADQFGIEVVDVRLRRFNYPDAVKPAVFAEIRSERERVAVQYRAEGASQKLRLESQATLERDQLLARAKREATRIRGEGEAKAMEILNAAHGKNPKFYELLKTLETYRAMLDDQTTVVLSAESPLLKLFTRGLPALGEPPVPGKRGSEKTVPTSTTTANEGKPESRP